MRVLRLLSSAPPSLAAFAVAMVALAGIASASDIRPVFSAGWAVPHAQSGYQGGFLASAGLEFVATRHASVTAEFQAARLAARQPTDVVRPALGPVLWDGPTSDIALFTSALGVRLQPFGVRARPYVEAGLGGQWSSARDTRGGFVPARATDVAGIDAWYVPKGLADAGMIGRVRLGASFARVGSSGFFADVGYEFPLGNPDHDWLIPMRLGVELP